MSLGILTGGEMKAAARELGQKEGVSVVRVEGGVRTGGAHAGTEFEPFTVQVKLMKELVIHGWNVGLDKILLTKTLRAEFGYSLGDGKSVTDRVLADEEVRISLEGRTVEDCNDVLRKLQGIGVKASLSDL